VIATALVLLQVGVIVAATLLLLLLLLLLLRTRRAVVLAALAGLRASTVLLALVHDAYRLLAMSSSRYRRPVAGSGGQASVSA
jgi:hypothetical protein